MLPRYNACNSRARSSALEEFNKADSRPLVNASMKRFTNVFRDIGEEKCIMLGK